MGASAAAGVYRAHAIRACGAILLRGTATRVFNLPEMIDHTDAGRGRRDPGRFRFQGRRRRRSALANLALWFALDIVTFSMTR
jgi:hypothetical protein